MRPQKPHETAKGTTSIPVSNDHAVEHGSLTSRCVLVLEDLCGVETGELAEGVLEGEHKGGVGGALERLSTPRNKDVVVPRDRDGDDTNNRVKSGLTGDDCHEGKTDYRDGADEDHPDRPGYAVDGLVEHRFGMYASRSTRKNLAVIIPAKFFAAAWHMAAILQSPMIRQKWTRGPLHFMSALLGISTRMNGIMKMVLSH
jgi:hypothetical protein